MKDYRNSVTDSASPVGNETGDATDQVYRQAFADALFEFAKGHLCGKCSTVLESAALSRYRLAMAKRRGEIDALRTKLEKQRAIENRRRELDRQNKANTRQKGTAK